MAERTVVGKNVWLYIKAGTTLIPIKCLTTHEITGSQEMSNTETKCGRKKSPQGDPDFQITGEGQIQLLSGADNTNSYSIAHLFEVFSSQQKFDVVSAPNALTPVAGDITYTGSGYLSDLNITYPAGEESTFSFTVDIDGYLVQTVAA